ncbi:unnamed protein product [Polarella glacialis]|uniref:Uncharacterized protein n=1 Tax=Polarella glacialis TaxID=89957 RepID=A0A813D4N9_POLGL|nr:unnamed protein product [Polarella glacialis]
MGQPAFSGNPGPPACSQPLGLSTHWAPCSRPSADAGLSKAVSSRSAAAPRLPALSSRSSTVTSTFGCAVTAAAASLAACVEWRRLRRREVRVRRGAIAQERNRGLDPKRLLDTMRLVGIGTPKPLLPGPAATANSRDAALLLLEQRRLSLQQGRAGLRPSSASRDYRLPLLVKYHKPAGVAASMKLRGQGREDLRSVVAMAGDKFELDLYHPVGKLSMKSSGLLLWSRSGRLTKQILDPRRGVVVDFEVECMGVVDAEKVGAQLRAGIPLGIIGFQTTYTADVREASLLPDSPLQDPRSRVVVATRDARDQITKMLQACGHKVIKIKRSSVGVLSLDGLKEGQLQAASDKEEAWACKFAGLNDEEYPPGYEPEVVLEPTSRRYSARSSRR